MTGQGVDTRTEGTTRRILVVYGHDQVRAILGRVLAMEQLTVVAVADMDSGRHHLTTERFDLVLLDLDLPDAECSEVHGRIASSRDTPVIALSNSTAEALAVKALDAGAVDFVIKPFRIRELVARVRAQLRYAGQERPASRAEVLEVSPVRLELPDRRAVVAGHEVHLTTKEFELLAELVRHAGRTVSRLDLLGQVWGGGYPKNAKTLDVHLSRIRDKIEAHTGATLIHTVRGFGYRYDSPPLTSAAAGGEALDLRDERAPLQSRAEHRRAFTLEEAP